jgi:hypothetical protein
MISWRGVAKKRRKPKLGWMKLKSSATVASKQQSWPDSNHFVSNWHIAVAVGRGAKIKKAPAKRKEPVTCDRPFLWNISLGRLLETRLG